MLTYDTLIANTENELMVFKDKYHEMLSNGEFYPEEGVYIIFENVFTPLLVDAIKNNNKPICTLLLDYLEKMAGSKDDEVVGVCDYSVLEVLTGEFKDEEIIPLLGEHTKEGYLAVKQYMW